MSIDGFLARKYAIMQQQADAASQNAQAETDLVPARIGSLAARGVGDLASAGVAAAQAKSIGVNSQLAQDAAPSEIAQRQAQTALTGAQAGLTTEQGKTVALGNQPADPAFLRLLGAFQGVSIPNNYLKGLTSAGGITTPSVRTISSSITDTPEQKAKRASAIDALNSGTLPAFGFSKGTKKVPGSGTGDTVPAMLSPGEAVINKEGAEHIGRGAIEAINAVGLIKRALGAGEGGAAPQLQADGESGSTGVRGYAKGTSKVTKKAPSKKAAAPAVDPKVLAMIMGMGAGG